MEDQFENSKTDFIIDDDDFDQQSPQILNNEKIKNKFSGVQIKKEQANQIVEDNNFEQIADQEDSGFINTISSVSLLNMSLYGSGTANKQKNSIQVSKKQISDSQRGSLDQEQPRLSKGGENSNEGYNDQNETKIYDQQSYFGNKFKHNPKVKETNNKDFLSEVTEEFEGASSSKYRHKSQVDEYEAYQNFSQENNLFEIQKQGGKSQVFTNSNQIEVNTGVPRIQKTSEKYQKIPLSSYDNASNKNSKSSSSKQGCKIIPENILNPMDIVQRQIHKQKSQKSAISDKESKHASENQNSRKIQNFNQDKYEEASLDDIIQQNDMQMDKSHRTTTSRGAQDGSKSQHSQMNKSGYPDGATPKRRSGSASEKSNTNDISGTNLKMNVSLDKSMTSKIIELQNEMIAKQQQELNEIENLKFLGSLKLQAVNLQDQIKDEIRQKMILLNQKNKLLKINKQQATLIGSIRDLVQKKVSDLQSAIESLLGRDNKSQYSKIDEHYISPDDLPDKKLSIFDCSQYVQQIEPMHNEQSEVTQSQDQTQFQKNSLYDLEFNNSQFKQPIQNRIQHNLGASIINQSYLNNQTKISQSYLNQSRFSQFRSRLPGGLNMRQQLLVAGDILSQAKSRFQGDPPSRSQILRMIDNEQSSGQESFMIRDPEISKMFGDINNKSILSSRFFKKSVQQNQSRFIKSKLDSSTSSQFQNYKNQNFDRSVIQFYNNEKQSLLKDLTRSENNETQMVKDLDQQNNEQQSYLDESSQMIRLSEGENNVSNLDQTRFNGIILPQTPQKNIQYQSQNQFKDVSVNMDLSGLISRGQQIQQEQNKNTDSSRLLDLTNLNEDSALDKLSSSEVQSRSQNTNSDKQTQNNQKRNLDAVTVPYNLRDQTMQMIPEVSGTAENESTFQQEIENKEAQDQSMTSIRSSNVNQLVNFFDTSMQSKQSVLKEPKSSNEKESRKAPEQSLQDISDINVRAIYTRHTSGKKVKQLGSAEKQSARKLDRLSPDQKKKILEKRRREKQMKSKSVILDKSLNIRSRCDNLEKGQIDKLVQKQRQLLTEKLQLSQQLQDSQNQILQLEKKIKALVIALENGGARAFNDISAIIQDTSQIAPLSSFPFAFRAKNDITKSFIGPTDGVQNMNLTQFDNLFTQLQTTQLGNDDGQQIDQSRIKDNLQKNIEDIEAQNQLYAKQLEITQQNIMNLAANASLVFENQPHGMMQFDLSDIAGVSQISRFGMNQQRFQNEINGSFMDDMSAIQQPISKFGSVYGKSYVQFNNDQGTTPRQMLDDSNFNCEVNEGDESKIGIGEQRTGLGESVNLKNKSKNTKNPQNQNIHDEFLQQTPENFKNLPQALTSTIRQTNVQNRANYRDLQSVNPFALNQFEQAALRAQIFAINNNQNQENDAGDFRKTADFANFKEVRSFANQSGNDSQVKVLDQEKSEEISQIQKSKNEIEVDINFNALVKGQDSKEQQMSETQDNINEFRGSIHQALPAAEIMQTQDSIGQIKVIQKQKRKTTPFDEDGDDTVEEDGSYSAFRSLKQKNSKKSVSNEDKSDDANSISKAGSKRLPQNMLPKQNEQVERSLKNLGKTGIPAMIQPQRNSNERTDILGNMSYISVIPRDQDASYAVYLNNTQMGASGVPGTLINSPFQQQQDFLLNSFYANASFLNNVSVFEARNSASEKAEFSQRGSKGKVQADQDFNIGQSPATAKDKFEQNSRFQTTDGKSQQIQKTPQTPFFADIKTKNTGQSKITQNQFSEKFIRPYNPEQSQSPVNRTKSDISHEQKDKSESDPEIIQNQQQEPDQRFTLGDGGYALTLEEAAVIQLQQQYLQEQQMRQRMLQFELLQQQEALRQMQMGQTSLLRAAQSGLGASALNANSMITASFGGFGNSIGGLSQNQIQSIIMSQHENAKDKESIKNMFLQMVGRGSTVQRETFGGEPARQSLGGGKNFFSNLLKQKKGQKQE